MNKSVKLYHKNYYENGRYQKILWLGVNSFMIINEPDREIFLVDPWPSYAEETNTKTLGVELLTNWLIKAYNDGFKITGIIGTHEHFDHIADIPIIFIELFIKGIPVADLPYICADQGTLEAIEDKFVQIFKTYIKAGTRLHTIPDVKTLQQKYIDFKLKGTPLYFDDEIQKEKRDSFTDINIYPLIAGTKLDTVNIGKYLITPFIWDHSTSFDCFDALSGVKSGNLQRSTAFLLECENDPERKRVFIIGSAGEMSNKMTGGYVKNAKIETDVLIQAIPHELIWFTSSYREKLNAVVRYQKQNIVVNEIIIACHFENFYHLKSIDSNLGDLELSHNQIRIKNYSKKLGNSRITSRTVYYLNRFLIEYGVTVNV